MEEKKLTDEEILKALECCAKDSSCLWDSKCPLRNDKDCHVTLSREALDIINRQNKDYIELDLECRELRTELEKELAEHEEFTKKAKDEIETLLCKNAELEVRCEGILKDYYAECQTCDEQKAEIERLKEKSISHYRDSWKNKFFKAQEELERLTGELKYYRGELQ